MSEHPLGLRDEEFWTDPYRTRVDVTFALMAKGKGTVLLDAPGRVDLTRSTLPAVAIFVAEPGERAAVAELGVVVVIDRVTGLVHAGPAQPRRDAPNRPRRAPLPAPPEGAPKPKGSMSAAALTTDLRQLAFPWSARRLVARAMVRGRLSDAVVIELVPPADAPREPDPPEARTIEAGPDTGKPPGVPATPGLALSVEPVNLLRGPKPEVVLRVAFRAPAHTVLRRGEPPPGAPSPSATVRLGIVVVGADSNVPRVMNVEVQSFDPIGADDPAPVVTGWFALDLVGRGLDGRQPQTVFVTALCGPLAGGPASVSTVTPEQLQGE